MSVPNGKSIEGGRNRKRIRIAVGSTGVISGAKTAASTSATTSTAPMRNDP